MPEKIFIQDGEQDRELELDLDEVTIGRADDNIIQLTEKRSSRQHCRIEETPDGYVLHDLGTSNGTRLNGVRVEGSIALKVGDQIAIGEARIRIGEPVVAEATPPATPEAKPEASSAAKPEAAERKKSERRKAAKAPRKKTSKKSRERREPTPTSIERQQMAWVQAKAPMLIVPLVLLIGASSAWSYYTTSVKADELAALHKKVQQSVDGAFTAADMRAAVDDIETWKLKVDSYDMTERYAKKLIALEQTQKTLTARADKWLTAQKELDNLRARRGAGMDDRDYYGRLLSLKRGFGDTPTVTDIDGEIEAVQLAVREKLLARVNEVRIDVTRLVDAKQYRKALDAVTAFEKVLTEGELKDDEMAKGIAFKLAPMRKLALNAMNSDLELLTSRFEAAVALRKFDHAKDLLVSAVDRFKGTPYVYQLRRDIEAVRYLRKLPAQSTGGGQSTGGQAESAPKVDLEAARRAAAESVRYMKVLDQAKELCRAGKYAEAVKVLEPVAGKGGALGAEFSAYVADIEGFLALKKQLVEQINGGKLEDATWKMGNRDWTITGADDSRVTLRMNGGAGTTGTSWKQLGNKGLYTLFTKMTLEPEQWQTIGAYCWYHDMEREAHWSLIEGIKRKSSTRDDVYRMYSRLSGIAQPDGGFVVYMRRIMTARDREMAKAETKVDRLLGKLGGGGASSKKAFDEFQQVMQEAAQKYGQPFADKLKSNVVDKLNKRRSQALAQLKNGAGLGTVDQLEKLQDELDKRREHALKLIFDVKAYPYDACHGCKAQPEVNKRVNAVKEIWNDPFNSGVIPGSVAGQVDRVKQIEEQLAKLGSKPTAGNDDIDLDHVKAIANKKLDIKTYGGNGSKSTIAHNEKVMKENEEKETVATNAEKRQVEITNEYRIMMGRRALTINDPLVLAARHHSEYMQSTGKWGHVIAGHPNGDTPGERAKKEGYTSGVGENIFKGSASPQSAFDAWYNSSGHHRNMLNPRWRSMGAGHGGKHWTQLFGGK